MGKYWKMKKVGVRQFYKEHLPSLPIDSKFRQYRVRTWDNNWIKIQDTIRTPKDLQRWLIRLAPRDVYFMTSRFLNPTKVGPRVLRKYKPGYNLAILDPESGRTTSVSTSQTGKKSGEFPILSFRLFEKRQVLPGFPSGR